MLDLRLQFETIRDLRTDIVSNIAETKRRLLDVETRQSETVREVFVSSIFSYCCSSNVFFYIKHTCG